MQRPLGLEPRASLNTILQTLSSLPPMSSPPIPETPEPPSVTMASSVATPSIPSSVSSTALEEASVPRGVTPSVVCDASSLKSVVGKKAPKLCVVSEIGPTWTIEQIVRERVPRTWERVFENAAPELHDISEMLVEEERNYGSFYPSKRDLFRALELTPLPCVRVVLVGQDPYHQAATATGLPRAVGLSFSVSRQDSIPSSLANIYTELEQSLPGTKGANGKVTPGFTRPWHGDLTEWALRGVLLINMCLTVRPNEPGSHGQLWMGFVIKILQILAEERPQTVYILLGKEAGKLQRWIGDKATVVTAAHPSGLSARRGFFGSGVFRKVNEALIKRKEPPIDWTLSG